MKVALITPIPDLHRFATRSRIHLLLAELCEDTDYVDFYKHRREVGDYLILDNGAHEHDEPVKMSRLMELGQRLNAQEIVLPDVQLRGDMTQRTTRDAIDWLVVHQGDYESDYHPRFMIVPQGRSMTEWNQCRWRLMHAVKDALKQVPVVGIAKHHEHVIHGGVLRLVAECQSWHAHADIHLLGWPRNLFSVANVATSYPGVRSIDTARPFTFTKQGIDLADSTHKIPDPAHFGYPSRDAEFFTEPVVTQDRGIAYRNIAWFQDRASGAPVGVA